MRQEEGGELELAESTHGILHLYIGPNLIMKHIKVYHEDNIHFWAHASSRKVAAQLRNFKSCPPHKCLVTKGTEKAYHGWSMYYGINEEETEEFREIMKDERVQEGETYMLIFSQKSSISSMPKQNVESKISSWRKEDEAHSSSMKLYKPIRSDYCRLSKCKSTLKPSLILPAERYSFLAFPFSESKSVLNWSCQIRIWQYCGNTMSQDIQRSATASLPQFRDAI